MTKLSGIIDINRRFARSARVDADLTGTPPLIGYVLQASVAKALSTMALAQSDSRQGAFTWTGPYGGGKSSAALLVANLVAGSADNRRIARELAGDALCRLFAAAFPERDDWRVVAVTGSRIRLRAAIASAAGTALGWSPDTFEAAFASDEALINALLSPGPDRPSVFLILDELGKMLEHEALEGGDVHLLQDLAERASRSDGRLVVVGILHQSFDQYAARAKSNARDEWAKVQGRYHDVAFLSGADETVALLGQAISCTRAAPASAGAEAARVAHAVAKRRPTDVSLLSEGLLATWPLNPVTALLLGPVSRQRFAQNERSLFGFLSSAEPNGFQEFLKSASTSDSYSPAQLWDYLAANFGMALASGADSHRFSLAFEAIERAAAKGGPVHVELTKAAAMIEFFRNGSGLAVADDVLAAAVPGYQARARKRAVQDLLDWAIFIRQPRLGGYALFAGSDFDLDEAVRRASGDEDAALAAIPDRVGVGFAAAKRHYFKTGALRTFDVLLCPVEPGTGASDVAGFVSSRQAKGSGFILLLVGDAACDADGLDALAQASAEALGQIRVIAAVAGARDGGRLRYAAAELAALERVIAHHPQLEGDRIARREIAARQSGLIDELHRLLQSALGQGAWSLTGGSGPPVMGSLATVASALADAAFPQSPIIQSELLQRDRPSSSAAAAVRELAHAMVQHGERKVLGIDGVPAEMGLYLTVLQPLGLHRAVDGKLGFQGPDDSSAGRSLAPAWAVLADSHEVRLGEVFAVWAAAPFGLKKGIMPLLALSYVLASSDRVAVYIDDVFQTVLDDVFADRFLQAPGEVRLRRISRSHREAAFLSGLAQRLGVTHEGASLPVAQALFQRFEALPVFAQRTQRVSEDAQEVRRTVLKANDPETLLFEALPQALRERLSADLVFDALVECEGAYSALRDEMTVALARALGADLQTFEGVTDRAKTVTGLTNDLSFDAFAMRAAGFEHGNRDIEGLVSLLVHKPASNWSDRDRDQALTEMARYGRRMREMEALAVIRDRRTDTEALALVVGVDPKIPPLLRSFELNAAEKRKAAALADRLIAALSVEGHDDHLKFAALARAVAVLTADSSINAEAA